MGQVRFRWRENHSLGEGELLLQTAFVRLFAHIAIHLCQNGE